MATPAARAWVSDWVAPGDYATSSSSTRRLARVRVSSLRDGSSRMERIPVRDPTDVAAARRRVAAVAAGLGYTDTQAGRVAIVVTELTQNMLRHAGGGEVLVGIDPADPNALEIMALD